MEGIRGMKDMMGSDVMLYNFIVEVIRRVSRWYMYDEVMLPIMEYSDIWNKSLGDTSDIVNKEMYTFNDKNNKSVTLRPEFTASMVRAVISNKIEFPKKLFTVGPLFRYERPQEGRYRQFYQASFEYFGCSGPYCDAEVIVFLVRILEALGISETSVLHINMLCDKDEMSRYKKELKEYFASRVNDLSDISKKRLENNPIRILDSKEDCDQKIIENAPRCIDYLSDEKRRYYGRLIKFLDAFATKEGSPARSADGESTSIVQEGSTERAGDDIAKYMHPVVVAKGLRYRENYRLVRGLDYYTSTVFEVTNEALGAQNAIAAGGRYDGLVGEMSNGSVKTPAIGFAIGIDRVMIALQRKLEGDGLQHIREKFSLYRGNYRDYVKSPSYDWGFVKAGFYLFPIRDPNLSEKSWDYEERMFHFFCFLKQDLSYLSGSVHLYYGFTGKERIRLMNAISPDYCFEFGARDAGNNKVMVRGLKEGWSHHLDFATYEDYGKICRALGIKLLDQPPS